MWPFTKRRTPLPFHGHVEERVVDDQLFVLGLDELYREAMKPRERGELRACAAKVMARLSVAPANVPIEGYYGEDAELAAYFRAFRALQGEGIERRREVAGMPEFERLLSVASAPLYGVPLEIGKLLPQGRDPLTTAMQKVPVPWTVTALVSRAGDEAESGDDCSLVGIAARTRDPVLVTAVRESVVLYAATLCTAMPTQPRYEWRVSPAIEAAARRFVETFRALFPDTTDAEFPIPEASAVETYWGAGKNSKPLGRCVRIATDDLGNSYHWAIRLEGDEFAVHDFWTNDVWTTDRYRQKMKLEGAPGFH
jgi:hypothetical protein